MLSKLLDISNNLYVTVISAECGEKRMTEKKWQDCPSDTFLQPHIIKFIV